MSTTPINNTPTKHIDGDVTIGRHVTVSGKADVQGDTRMGGNLKVEGWLEAKNVKSANKGLFATQAALNSAYPHPHDGWFAGVSASASDITALGLSVQAGKALFRMYVGCGGEWVCEPINKLYEITVDNEQVEDLNEAFTEFGNSLEALSAIVEGHTGSISNLSTTQTTQGNTLNTHTTEITNLSTRLTTAEQTAGKASPRSIDLGDLDTMGTEGTLAAMNSFVRSALSTVGTLSNGAPHTRWAVTSSGKVVGALDVFTDNMYHVITQVIETHCAFEDGAISTTGHECSKLSRYCRSYKLSGPLDIEDGTWTPWEECDSDRVRGLSKAVGEMSESIGKPDGIAPLGEDGLVPAEHLPAPVKEVVEIDKFVAAAETQDNGVNKSVGDAGCLLVYDIEAKRLLLAVPKIPAQQIGGELEAGPGGPITTELGYKYYTAWGDTSLYGDETGTGVKPTAGKAYICKADNTTYRWDGSDLVSVGSALELGRTEGTAFPGDAGKTLEIEVSRNKARISLIGISDFSGVADKFDDAFAANIMEGEIWFVKEDVTFLTKNDEGNIGVYADYCETNSKPKEDRLYRCGNRLYRFDGSALKDLSGSADGNCLNVTVELPKTNTTNPYYDLGTAIAAVFANERAKLGLQITFAATATTWKQYQYIGSTIGVNDFCSESNWIDMAGTSAGTEPVINVNDLCGEGALQYGAYTLESAIKAISDKETETGITYRKAGMVITYKIGDGKWESKQLVQTASSFNVPGAWEPFGSAKDSEAKTSDKPVKGGTDAFSTGGASSYIPVSHTVTQEDGTVSIQFKNSDGDEIMDPIEFLASQGGGGDSSGTIVSIAFQKAPLYGALGATLATKAAIRSVTAVGNVETDNSIEKLELIDKDTKAVVWTANVNKASSPSMASFTFDLDFSSFFSVAGQKTFTLVATDDTGKTGRKNITVIAEDLTLTCTQRLSETIAPADTQAYVEMYAFYNNQSAGGIRCKVDILIDNEWVNIHNEVVTNAFSRPVMFNAATLGLTHGSYQLRLQGESVDSGVKGNIVYSTIMCVDPSVTDGTLIALRYDDANNGTIRLFDTVSMDVSAWRKVNGVESSALVDMHIGAAKIIQIKVDPEKVVNFRKQISGYSQDDALLFKGTYGSVVSPEIQLIVDGSVLDISLKAGPSLDLDFASRTNDEADHTISDRGYTMTVIGANWTTNGFVEYLGANAFRSAENVKASIDYAPFGDSTIEQTGAVVQMKIATRNIRDKEAKLIECYDPDSGAGFYICGNKAVMYCKNGTDGNSKNYHETPLENGKAHTVAFVVEPASIYKERDGVKYSALKLYVDGCQEGMFAYIPGTGSVLSNKTISFDGTDGDLYLYYLLCYRSHYEWAQAFDNYLVKGTDTEAMVEEYNAENVAVSQTAEGTTAMRPSAAALWARGVRYMVNIDTENGFSVFDFGNGSEDNGFTTSPKFKNLTQVFNDPVRPWRSFKATKVTKKRQGTTSTLRCLKNEDDDYTKATITPLFPEYLTDAALRASLSAEELDDIAKTFALFEMGYIRIGDNSMPIQRAMNKVDFSDSSCANNGGVCDMMNATFRAMGPAYLTPSQRFYDGTWDKGDVHLTGIQLNHSIANFPCAIFRSTSETMQNVYFHARGSYMESKKEQRALGFRDVPGYNKGCLNYGEFKELFCAPGQTLAQYVAAADKSAWEYANEDGAVFNVIVISEYCGRGFKVFRRAQPGAEWVETTGSMKQVGGQWTVTGDVLNPVTGFELLNYTGICWWMGVATVDDMMAPTKSMSSWVEKLKLGAENYPYWTQFFECMIEDDQLAIDYAMGRKVPYELFNTLRFMDSVDYSQAVLAAAWKPRWKTEAWKFMSMESVMVYHIFTDYLAAVDQRAKNMQPMWFLEDGCYIENGQFYGVNGMEPCRMYLNKVYDCDTCNGQDNEGGKTVDPEVDPDKPTSEDEGYTNPYAGWGSILFNNIAKCKEEQIVCGAADEHGVLPTLTLTSVAQNMRSKQASLPDGRTITPFSPEGARYYFIEQRINKWPKKVSTYDCERKYIDRTAKANKIYFYAHQGSGRTGLNRFIDVRWLVRDGFYQTGGFFADPLVFRINCRPSAKIGITAAARGYFAVGYENIGQISGEAVFLEAGESYEFTEFSKVDGTQLYIYQTARMSRLDLSDLSISGANFSRCVLLEELVLGSATHENVLLGSYPIQTDLQLGNLPFLHTIDLRNTMIKSLNCSGCPRMAHIKAEGSQLQTMALAQTSPINDISLPDTMAELRFVGLPNLTYAGLPSDGLRVTALANVQKLRLESSPNIDAAILLKNIITAVGAALRSVRVAGQSLKGDASELQAIIAKGVKGMNDQGEENRPRPVIIGTYELTRLLEQSEIDEIEESVEGIEVSIVVEAFIDAIDQANSDYYYGEPEVDSVDLSNIGDHLEYYNGETYEDYLSRTLSDNESIHDIITQN